MVGLLLLLVAVTAVLGQRPGSGSSEPLCQYSKFPPSDALFFSLFLDQTGEDLLCEPFLMSLAGAIDVDMDQLGAWSVSSFFFWRDTTLSRDQRDAAAAQIEPVLVGGVGMGVLSVVLTGGVFSSTQKSGTGEGDFTALCSTALDKLMNTLRAQDGTEPLKLQYTVRSAIAPSGERVVNWRLQFQMPLWAPVVTVVGLLFFGGLLLFVLLFVLPNTGAGNPKF
jgi:hypothetical protein